MYCPTAEPQNSASRITYLYMTLGTTLIKIDLLVCEYCPPKSSFSFFATKNYLFFIILHRGWDTGYKKKKNKSLLAYRPFELFLGTCKCVETNNTLRLCPPRTLKCLGCMKTELRIRTAIVPLHVIKKKPILLLVAIYFEFLNLQVPPAQKCQSGTALDGKGVFFCCSWW